MLVYNKHLLFNIHCMNIKVLYQVIPRSLIYSRLDTAFSLRMEKAGAPRRVWIVLEKSPLKVTGFRSCVSELSVLLGYDAVSLAIGSRRFGST